MSTTTEAAIEKLTELIRSKPSGISNSDVEANLGSFPPETRLAALNELIKQNKIELLQKGNALLYKYKETNPKQVDMDNDEKVIYSIIESGGNTGIWVRSAMIIPLIN
jgi:DNA-directed RNA polymerase III subunit RPC6